MKKLYRGILLAFLLSCSSDSSVDLSGGYFLALEGRGANLIGNRSVSSREIPSNVISYNFNDQFIIAKQKPNAIDNVIFTPTIYKYGKDSIYYWLIVHDRKLVLGPMNEQEFDNASNLYKVPKTLDFKLID
jgi:hypothetical protein